MPKLTLSVTERICIAAVVILGDEWINEAYRLINPTSKSKDEATFRRQALRWWNHPNVKEFCKKLRNASPLHEKEDATITREYLIKQLKAALRATTDPTDRASIAMKLADLSGLKGKKEETPEADKRHYFLPWVSRCRTCELMKIYNRISNQKQTS